MGYTISSGKFAASGVVCSGACYFAGALLVSDGVNDPKVVVYDNVSGSGTVLAELSFNVTGSGLFVLPFSPGQAIRCDKGIYVTLTGTGASVIIYFEERG